MVHFVASTIGYQRCSETAKDIIKDIKALIVWNPASRLSRNFPLCIFLGISDMLHNLYSISETQNKIIRKWMHT